MVTRPQWRTVATVVLLVVALVPAFRDGDGLPLSSYSMYAQPRSDTVEFIVPVGLDLEGKERPLTTRTIAATSDPLIAEAFLRDEVRTGRAQELCSDIAARVGDDGVVSIEIRSERHRVVQRALGNESLVEVLVLASCQVP